MSEASRRSMRFMRATNLAPSATPTARLGIYVKDGTSCEIVVQLEDGPTGVMWRSRVVATKENGEVNIYKVGGFDSRGKARLIAERWVATILGIDTSPPRKRGESGKPRAV